MPWQTDVVRGGRAGAGLLAGILLLIGFAVFLRPTPAPPPYVPPPTVSRSSADDTVPAALWIGDSFTAGIGGSRAGRPYPGVVSARIGWVSLVDAEGGTGYINDGRANEASFAPFSGRLADDVRRYRPDIVIVDGGRNDRWSTEQDLTKAVTSYLSAVHAAWPQARLVVILPSFLTSKLDADLRDVRLYIRQAWAEFGSAGTGWLLRAGRQPTLRTYIRQAAERQGAFVVDPARLGWLSSEPKQVLVSADGVHPNDAGHTWYAAQLTNALRELALRLQHGK